MPSPRPPKRPTPASSPVVPSDEAGRERIVLSPDELVAFRHALDAPPTLTEAQRRLGAIMRGEG
jgi:hypothetical protein